MYYLWYWRQHPTRHQLYGHLPTITKTIQVRQTRHAGHCWRSRDELISDVLLWIPTYGRAKAGRPARTYIQQLCEDTGCSPEDPPEAMNNREKWRERVRGIRAGGTTWWWWFGVYVGDEVFSCFCSALSKYFLTNVPVLLIWLGRSVVFNCANICKMSCPLSQFYQNVFFSFFLFFFIGLSGQTIGRIGWLMTTFVNFVKLIFWFTNGWTRRFMVVAWKFKKTKK